MGIWAASKNIKASSLVAQDNYQFALATHSLLNFTFFVDFNSVSLRPLAILNIQAWPTY